MKRDLKEINKIIEKIIDKYNEHEQEYFLNKVYRKRLGSGNKYIRIDIFRRTFGTKNRIVKIYSEKFYY